MWQKSARELQEALSAPFQSADIEWRVSATNTAKTSGLAVPYVTNRAIQNRLDSTVGIDGWHNDFVPWKGEKAQLCGISIYLPELKDWLTKWDGADDSDIESVKGGLSDSMKRAAVEWGIGRYLYGMTQKWVSIEQRGKGYVICNNERPALDIVHDQWVQSLQQKKDHPGEQDRQGHYDRGQSANPCGDPHRQDGQQAPQIQGQPFQGQISSTGIPAGCYMVTGAVLKPTMSGNSRTSVQVRDSAGQLFQAYTRGADARLAPGLMLTNVQLSTQHNNGVTFYILESYQIMDLGGAQAA
ncbi:Rad52/Rad22 family DNA repair protein [Flavonifractor sp. An306]|uniref:Rad52/Rad22 family DNA repair protein n=1 Tax=Flavonifractor sp. An306 TaxID=1965629 RepID=UPI0013A60FCC|nr:Rad52/Rad22 family DNA repair protein [Flavonifractor sp. An306]